MFVYEHVLARDQLPTENDSGLPQSTSQNGEMLSQAIENELDTVAAVINSVSLTSDCAIRSPPLSAEYCTLIRPLHRVELIKSGLKIVRNTRVSSTSLRLWIAALVDLWNTQTAQGVNSYESPRSNWMAAVARALQRFSRERKKKAYVDKGIGTCV